MLTIPAALGVITMFGHVDWLGEGRSGVDSNPLVPYYAVFLAVWTSLFLELWCRREAELQFLWGVEDFEQEEVPMLLLLRLLLPPQLLLTLARTGASHALQALRSDGHPGGRRRDNVRAEVVPQAPGTQERAPIARLPIDSCPLCHSARSVAASGADLLSPLCFVRPRSSRATLLWPSCAAWSLPPASSPCGCGMTA